MKQSHKLNATSSTQQSRNKIKNEHRTATALDAQGCVLNLEFEPRFKKKNTHTLMLAPRRSEFKKKKKLYILNILLKLS